MICNDIAMLVCQAYDPSGPPETERDWTIAKHGMLQRVNTCFPIQAANSLQEHSAERSSLSWRLLKINIISGLCLAVGLKAREAGHTSNDRPHIACPGKFAPPVSSRLTHMQTP